MFPRILAAPLTYFFSIQKSNTPHAGFATTYMACGCRLYPPPLPPPITHPAGNKAILGAGLADHNNGLRSSFLLLKLGEVRLRQQRLLADGVSWLYYRSLPEKAAERGERARGEGEGGASASNRVESTRQCKGAGHVPSQKKIPSRLYAGNISSNGNNTIQCGEQKRGTKNKTKKNIYIYITGWAASITRLQTVVSWNTHVREQHSCQSGVLPVVVPCAAVTAAATPGRTPSWPAAPARPPTRLDTPMTG